MPAQAGRYTKLLLNIGTQSVPVWEAIADQTGMEINRGANTQQVSDKEHTYAITIATTKTASFSITGVMFRSAETLRLIRDHYENQTEAQFRIVDLGNQVEEVFGKVTAFNESHPVDNISTYSLEISPTEAPVRL